MTDKTLLLWLILLTSTEILLIFQLVSRRENVLMYIQSMLIHPASVPGQIMANHFFRPLLVQIKLNVRVHLFQCVNKGDLRPFQPSCLAE
jgi:hypothetical protein